MMRSVRGQRQPIILIAVIVIGIAIPLIWYWLAIGRSPGIDAKAAHGLIQDGSATLVQIEATPYVEPEAVDWPFFSIRQVRSPADVPAQLAGQKLLLLCNGGIRSAMAARHLQKVGVPDVYSIRGGWQEWVSTPLDLSDLPEFRASPMYQQAAVVIAFFGFKFLYSAGAAGIWWALRKPRSADLLALRWSMLFFFIGEGCCAINVLVFHEHSFFLEHLHSVGMVLSLAFAWWSAIEAVDKRVLHYSDEQRCIMSGLCRGCAKHADVPCGLRRTFIMLIPIVAVLAIMPLFSEFRLTTYNTRVFAAVHSYRHPILHQLYEIRYLPIMAGLLSLASLASLIWEKRSVPVAKLLLSAALGAMSFSLLRLFLVASYEQNQVWFAFWEELTELIYIGAVAGVLWSFRHGLLSSPVEKGESSAVRA